jgi:hypothetical protein
VSRAEHLRRTGRWCAAGLAPLTALLLAAGCPGGDTTGGSAGAAGIAGQAGSAGAPDANDWDPVWHQTEPAAWETVGPENNPDCGPGCRVALNVPAGNPTGLGHSASPAFLASGGPLGQAFARIGDTVTPPTLIIPAGGPNAGLVRQSIWEGRLSAARVISMGNGQVEVIDLLTGESKVIFSYQNGQYIVIHTALGPNHAYWESLGMGVVSRNLTTGEVRTLKSGGCWKMIGVEQGLLCEDGRIYLANPLSGDVSKIDSGPAFQLDLACSPDRKQCAWIDFRDPPGENSTRAKMVGGEVYVTDLDSGQTQRVTFDSPDAPRGKWSPAVDGNLVVWHEEDAVRFEPQPESAVAYSAKTLSRVDMETGERCRLTSPTQLVVGLKILHGKRIYGTWVNPTENPPWENRTWIVEIDLDDPELVWECQ